MVFNLPNVSGAAGDFVIDNSVYGDGSTGYFQVTLTTSATTSGSVWHRRTKLGAVQPIYDNKIYFNASDQLVAFGLTSTAIYRDVSAFHHIYWNSTGVYVNGTLVTGTGTYTPASVTNPRLGYDGTNFNAGYFSDFTFWDGTSVALNGGETDTTTGSWKPKLPTSGWYSRLLFDNGASLGESEAGGTNWTKTGTVTQTTDSPTDDAANNIGNYCTLNPLDKAVSGGTVTLSNGNLSWSGGSNITGCRSTMFVSSGKWYFEWTYLTDAKTDYIGLAKAEYPIDSHPLGGLGYDSGGRFWGMDLNTGDKVYTSTAAYGSGFAANDVAMIALDLDNGKIWGGKNGTWFNSGDPAAGTNAAFTGIAATLCPYIESGNANATGKANFGQTAFAYTPPTGFKRLCTANLLAPTVKDSGLYHNVVTYTGTGATLTITGVGFQSDLVMIKSRSAATDWAIYDSTRGAQKRLESNTSDTEVTTDGGLTSFDADGFTLSTLAQVNTNGATYVASCWKKGATPGFDVISYAGAATAQNISHALGAVPKFMIVKRRDVLAADWAVYHASDNASPQGGYMVLNSTAAFAADVTVWNNTTPTSSVFSVGTLALTNAAATNYIAYLWAEISGFSKFGSYTGNGSADGPFVWCGFRPKFVLFKRCDAGGQWYLFDTARNTINVAANVIYPHLPAAENDPSYPGVTANFDFLSTGFKLRATNASDFNGS